MQRGQGPEILKQFFLYHSKCQASFCPTPCTSQPESHHATGKEREDARGAVPLIPTAGLVKSGFSIPDSVPPAHRAEH